MGLHGPMTENGFTHNQAQKFITKKHRNPLNGNTWTTRFTVKVEYIGVISEEVSEMLELLFSKFSFLGWSGRYAFDPRGDFTLRCACECTSMEDSSKKWIHAQTMRRSAAHPDSCSQHTPMPPQGQSPLLVPLARKPDGTNATTMSESNEPIGPMPTAPAGALLQQPVTPPAKSPKQEDPPSSSKRQKISGDESRPLLHTIGSEEKVQHSLCRDSQACREAEPLAQRGDVLALWHPLPGDADFLSDEEQGSFTAALRMALVTVQQQYEEVKSMMVQAEQWTSLQLIQQSVDVMDQCVTANHAGADKDRRRSTAVGTVDLLC